MHGIRQNQLLRDVQDATALRQVSIHPRVGFQHVGKPHLIFRREVFQWLFVIIRNGNDLILTNQTAAIGWQRIGDSRRCIAKAYDGEGCR